MKTQTPITEYLAHPLDRRISWRTAAFLLLGLAVLVGVITELAVSRVGEADAVLISAILSVSPSTRFRSVEYASGSPILRGER